MSIYDHDLPVSKGRNLRPYVTNYIDIPCGQCIGCRLQRSREWANRMMLELETSSSAAFVTLTYDDLHLHMVEGVHRVTGELENYATLCLEDLQKFIKRLRKRFPDKNIRYFACGEYGEQTQRPHYHLIIFNWFPDDAKFVARGRKGEYNYYSSEVLFQLWPFGHHVLADVTWESCAYTARYVVKKYTGDQSVYYELKNIKPPFVIMSKKPGIGYEYYFSHPDLFPDGVRYRYLSTPTGSISFSKPRYFKKLDDLASFIPLDPQTYIFAANEGKADFDEMAYNQEQDRKVMALSTDLEYFENLAVQGLYKEQQISILKRGLI